jgi:hypothetical protein
MLSDIIRIPPAIEIGKIIWRWIGCENWQRNRKSIRTSEVRHLQDMSDKSIGTKKSVDALIPRRKIKFRSKKWDMSSSR